VRGGYQTYELGTWLMSNRQNGYRPGGFGEPAAAHHGREETQIV
jgi:hypothetical protein